MARLKLSAFPMLRRNRTNILDESVKRSQDLNRIIAIGAFIVVLLALALCAWAGEPEAKTPIVIPPPIGSPGAKPDSWFIEYRSIGSLRDPAGFGRAK